MSKDAYLLILHFDSEDLDEIVCQCGNQPHTDGFYPCDSNGTEIEPTLDSDWDGLYICPRCSSFHRFGLPNPI